MKGNSMIIDLDELMNEEEMHSENIRKAKDRYMECLRERGLPHPITIRSRVGEAAGD